LLRIGGFLDSSGQTGLPKLEGAGLAQWEWGLFSTSRGHRSSPGLLPVRLPCGSTVLVLHALEPCDHAIGHGCDGESVAGTIAAMIPDRVGQFSYHDQNAAGLFQQAPDVAMHNRIHVLSLVWVMGRKLYCMLTVNSG
jgi:hypothetical protein